MRRCSGLLALGAVSAVAGAGVAHAHVTVSSEQPPGPNTRIAETALDSALRAVAKRDPACRSHVPHIAHTVTHEPIPQEMLASFAVLRRPKGPQDDFRDDTGLPFANKIAVDYIRRALVLPGGRSVFVIPALDARPAIAKRPAVCAFREREALVHRLRGKPAPAQRVARRQLRTLQDIEYAAARRTVEAGLFLVVRGPHSGVGGGATTAVADIRRFGTFVSSSAPDHRALLVGLVPDGVATIDFSFGTAYHRTVAVTSNVIALTVPRAPQDALVNRQVWHAADGSVVNTVRSPH
jgi:hypothetical protein